jgi:hypothetical protein
MERTTMIKVGGMAWLPSRFAHGGHTALIDEPGRVVSIDDTGWAIVDRGRWGQIGCPVEDLVSAELPPKWSGTGGFGTAGESPPVPSAD